MVAAARINNDTGQREEELIPQTGFAHSAHRRTFERVPHEEDIGEEDGEADSGKEVGATLLAFPSTIGSDAPKEDRRDSEIDEIFPNHGCSGVEDVISFVFPKLKKSSTAPRSSSPMPR